MEDEDKIITAIHVITQNGINMRHLNDSGEKPYRCSPKSFRCDTDNEWVSECLRHWQWHLTAETFYLCDQEAPWSLLNNFSFKCILSCSSFYSILLSLGICLCLARIFPFIPHVLTCILPLVAFHGNWSFVTNMLTPGNFISESF